MKVILKKDVPKKGSKYSIIDVPAGYAHNLLFRSDLAVPVNKANLKWLKDIQLKDEEKAANELERCQQVANQIKGVVLHFELTGREGKVANSISNKQITDKLLRLHQIKVDKRKFMDYATLNAPGRFIKKVKLHPQVTAELEINITHTNK